MSSFEAFLDLSVLADLHETIFDFDFVKFIVSKLGRKRGRHVLVIS